MESESEDAAVGVGSKGRKPTASKTGGRSGKTDEEDGGKADRGGGGRERRDGESVQEIPDRDLGESVDSSSDEHIPLSSPSGLLTSASFDSLPWESSEKTTFSMDSPSGDSELDTSGSGFEPCEGDASNGRLDLKMIWFNFASPPPISINKKVDFTR